MNKEARQAITEKVFQQIKPKKYVKEDLLCYVEQAIYETEQHIKGDVEKGMNTIMLTDEELSVVRAAVIVHYCNMSCDFPKSYESVRKFHKELEGKLRAKPDAKHLQGR